MNLNLGEFGVSVQLSGHQPIGKITGMSSGHTAGECQNQES